MLLQGIVVLEHAPAFLALDPGVRIQFLDMAVHEFLGGVFKHVFEPSHKIINLLGKQ